MPPATAAKKAATKAKAKAVENPTFKTAVRCAVGVLVVSGAAMVAIGFTSESDPQPVTKMDLLYATCEKAFFMVLGAIIGVFAGKASGANGDG